MSISLAIAYLYETASSLGLNINNGINTSGKITNIFDDKKKKVGAYTFNINAGGSFGGYIQNLSAGIKENWFFADNNTDQSPAAREQIKRDIAEHQRKQRAQEAYDHKKTAEKARYICSKTTAAPHDFPYLVKKGITAHNARLNRYRGEDFLVIPIGNRKQGLRNLQMINAQGAKHFLKGGEKKGCYSILNFTRAVPELIGISEGFATAASLLEHAQQDGVAMMSIMACDAGNLEPVALTIKKLYPDTPIIIFGDNDTNKAGQLAARTAAKSINARFLIPHLADCDFNDLISSGNALPFNQLISHAVFNK